MTTNWHRRLQQRASRALPARLGRCALLGDAEAARSWPSPLMALPGARIAPGLVRFALAAETRDALLAGGLDYLRDARHARGPLYGGGPLGGYAPWHEGTAAIERINGRVSLAWPLGARVYSSVSCDGTRWLAALPVQGELWYGWQR